jgi:hypothetical protein
MLMAYFASRCFHALVVCCFFLLAIIYVPQYAFAFLMIVFADVVALVAVIVPAGFFTTRPESHLRVKGR